MSAVNSVTVPSKLEKNEVVKVASHSIAGALPGHHVEQVNPETPKVIDQAKEDLLRASAKTVQDIMLDILAKRLDGATRQKLLESATTSTVVMSDDEQACFDQFSAEMVAYCAQSYIRESKSHPILAKLVEPRQHLRIVKAQFMLAMGPFVEKIRAISPEYIAQVKENMQAQNEAMALLDELGKGLDTFTLKDIEVLQKHVSGNDIKDAPLEKAFSCEDNLVKAQALIGVVREAKKSASSSALGHLKMIIQEQLEKISPPQNKKEETPEPAKKGGSFMPKPGEKSWGGIL
jgi:hypothetical protein